MIGGVHTLANTEEILKTGLFDYVFRGECENAFLEFVNRLQRGESVEDVPNLAYVAQPPRLGLRIRPPRAGVPTRSRSIPSAPCRT